jgi:hypothetical protein
MKKKNLLFYFCLFLSFFLHAQDQQQNFLDSLSGRFITEIRKQGKPRALLVTDKSIFKAGETIWFRGFLVNSVSQKIVSQSKYLFVDLVNEKDSVITAVILDAANLQLNSRIVLTDAVSEGNYWLRAYTRHMAEGDSNSIFVKPIYVAGRNSNNHVAELKKNSGKDDSTLLMTFYPEGGSIMTGINSTIALSITDKDGAPVSIDGYVKDSRDNITARFTTNESGLAKFNFEPSRFRRYKGVVNWNGKEITYPLPLFNFYSGQLAVTQQPTGYKLRVLLEDSLYRKDFVSYMIGVSKDSLVYASIGTGLYEVAVDKQILPEGITTFYLFDKSFNLLSERSVYVRDNGIYMNASTEKTLYGRRDKVTLNLSITNAEKHLIPSLLAISVVDTLTSGALNQCTGPFRANYDQPVDNLFIAGNNCLTDADLDLMMLVKKNNYETLSKSEFRLKQNNREIYRDSLLFIKGTVLNEKNEPSANRILTLFSNSGNPVLYSDTTDDKGHFSFPIDSYADSTQFTIQVTNLNGNTQKAKIEYEAINYPKIKTPVALKQYLPLQTNWVKRYLTTYHPEELIGGENHLLKEVKVKAKKNVDYDEFKRVSSQSAILTSNDLDENTPLDQSLLGVGGLHMAGRLLVIGGPSTMIEKLFTEPLLIVDGVEVQPPASVGTETSSGLVEYLKGVNPKDIDFIEVLKYGDASAYGMRGGNGVIILNTVGKGSYRKVANNNLNSLYAKGVSNTPLFPSLNYQQKNMKISSSADTRSTLFWNGNFLTDDTHNVALTFYTSDIPATYIATITGITIHGDIIYKTVTFKSK